MHLRNEIRNNEWEKTYNFNSQLLYFTNNSTDLKSWIFQKLIWPPPSGGVNIRSAGHRLSAGCTGVGPSSSSILGSNPQDNPLAPSSGSNLSESQPQSMGWSCASPHYRTHQFPNLNLLYSRWHRQLVSAPCLQSGATVHFFPKDDWDAISAVHSLLGCRRRGGTSVHSNSTIIPFS